MTPLSNLSLRYERWAGIQSWTTEAELEFIKEQRGKGNWSVLDALAEYVEIRRWDKGVDVQQVKAALTAALEDRR